MGREGCDGKSNKGGKMLVLEEYVRGVLRSGDRTVRAGIIGSKQ